MFTKIMKWISLSALTGGLFFRSLASSYAVLLQFVICGSASLVTLEAVKSGKYLWAACFTGLAILFNPLVTVAFATSVFPWITSLCCSMVLASLVALKTAPRLSILSITYAGPRSQSL